MKPTNEGSLAAERGRRELESGAEWQAIREAFFASGDAAAAQSAITRMTESAVARACEETLERWLPGPLAVYAVGGFARGALLPYAHPEILVMRESERPAAGESGAEFAARLRERGVLPGVRIHTLAECGMLLERNPDLARKLLDRRLLRGDGGLAARFERELAGAFAQRGGALAGRLAAEAVARHARSLDTASHREPDVEDGPGGGRDLGLLMALGRLVPGGIAASAPAGAAEFLARALCYLHYRAGEERSVLDLAAQQAIAAQFAPGMAPAEWMREYFRHARGVYFALRRAIDDRAEEPPAQQALGWAALEPMLSTAQAGRALRALESSASLAAAIPEWTRIEGLVDADPDRTLTLDEHTLRAVDALGALDGAEEAAHRRFAELLPDAEGRAVLTFALLFHHMGEAAAGAAARTGMPAAARELLAFLVESRAGLFELLGGRDLDDPGTIRLAADRAGTVERLGALTLTTYADLCATYREPMLPWRLEQLWRAYQATRRELTRELESDRIEEIPETLAENREFVTGFPTRYLRSRSAEEIRAHVRLFEQSRGTGVAVELEAAGGAYRLTVVAQDKPGLFASFAGAISSFGLDIVQAEAFANSQGVILDTFVVADPKRTLSVNPPEAERLRDLLGRIALGKTDARRLFRNRPQAAEKEARPPRVQFDAEACATATLVEIVADDRPGLLYSLASVFAGNRCNIDTVLIDTKGRTAIDVFYVARDGGKLPAEEQAGLERQLIAACLGTA